MMQLKFENWQEYHHQIYRIYHGIIAVSLVPFFLLFIELETVEIKESRLEGWSEWAAIIILITVCLWMFVEIWKGNRFSTQLEHDEVSLKEKLILFRKTEVTKYIWLEIASILSLLGLWLSAHYFFIIIYFAALVQFSFLRPSEDRLVRTMKLSLTERKEMHETDFK
ncbi:MAG: hypothetical protein Tsb0034_26400 [Ekhidna sp.]